MSLEIIKHLLPTGKAWSLTINKQLRQYCQGLANALIDPFRAYFDSVWTDIFPESTTKISEWEAFFNLPTGVLSESERRDRLDAAWQAVGGQSPRYIQDTLQANGFDVYVHEWWVPASDPPLARNPFITLGGSGALVYVGECGEPIAQCGEPTMQAGNTITAPGYVLVNKIFSTVKLLTALCGEPEVQCGEAIAESGQFSAYGDEQKVYVIAIEPEQYPYYLYIGGAVFGDQAIIDADRRQEFEDLCLKICPNHQWLGILVNYT